MKFKQRIASFSKYRLCALLLLGIAAGSVITVSAHHGGKHRHGKHKQRYHHDSRYDYRYQRYERPRYRERGYRSRERFRVPRMIRHDYAYKYKSYYYGRIYHAGHRHHHGIYRFPVFLQGRYVYRPHAYCNGDFYEVGVFTRFGPRFGPDVCY